MNALPWMMALLVFAGGTENANAADASYAELPQSVRSAVESFLKCSAVEAVDSRGSDHFAFCGAPVIWDPNGGENMRACLARHAIISGEEQPSVKHGAKEYGVIFACTKYQFLHITLQIYGDETYISEIGETLP